ncbi:DUF2357 domain-containing protein [Bordetella petrii]|nr:DUF2357 domain-containing protein [Bordetella petrii]
MLRIRPCHLAEDIPWQSVQPEGVLGGLHEDTDYLIDVCHPSSDAYIDDVPLERENATTFRWRPYFYAGRVVVDIMRSHHPRLRYFLDISPSRAKSGLDEFAAMVAEIEAFDRSLLSGLSSATMAFGHQGRTGRYELNVLLARIRQYGSSFLTAVEHIARSPHRFLAADMQVLPLSRVRRLHHRALQERRLVSIVHGNLTPPESIDAIQVNGLTSAPTFDTPANRTLLALLRRFMAATVSLDHVIRNYQLQSPQDEQILRAKRRLDELSILITRTRRLLFGSFFRDVSTSGTSAAGLTQVSAQPHYNKAYRLGCRALATQIDGNAAEDQLHIPPSWGIYELWCFLCAVTCIADITGLTPTPCSAKTALAERAVQFTLDHDHVIEVLFQATFPSLKSNTNCRGWSLSRERRPDIVIAQRRSSKTSAVVLDAKWRSGKSNILDAMESAHIYHDALRVGMTPPEWCILLLPGQTCVAQLEDDAFIQTQHVGAVSNIRPGAVGLTRIQSLIQSWLNGHSTPS